MPDQRERKAGVSHPRAGFVPKPASPVEYFKRRKPKIMAPEGLAPFQILTFLSPVAVARRFGSMPFGKACFSNEKGARGSGYICDVDLLSLFAAPDTRSCAD
jgi:hypothetical protein